MQVYICDDNDLDRERICRMLTVYAKRFKSRLKIWKFQNAGQMFDAMKESGTAPDLVFLDIYMEEMDGIEAGERLNSLSAGEIPVIFSTSSDEHAIRAFQLRAAGYLHKPYTQEDFNHALGRVEWMLRDSGRFLEVWQSERECTCRIWLENVLWLESEGRGTRFYLADAAGSNAGAAASAGKGSRSSLFYPADAAGSNTGAVAFAGITLFTGSPLKTFRDSLGKYPDFCECGRSCILHLTWANGMEEQGVRMKNGALVQVPVRLKAETAQRLENWRKDRSSFYIR